MYTTMYVFSYYYICVLILRACVWILLCMWFRTTIYASSYHYMCVLILRACVCVVLVVFWPRTIIYVSSYYEHMCTRATLYASSYYEHVSSYHYICVLILRACVCVVLIVFWPPLTPKYLSSYYQHVSSCYFVCVLIPLYVCPHSTTMP